MRIPRFCQAVVFCASLGFIPSSASASAFSFQGIFNTDDQTQVFSFVAGPGSAIFRTWGYAGSGGGTNANGQTILAGGFDPVLSLFGPGPALTGLLPLLTFNDNGGANVLADPVSLEHFDSYINTAAVPLTLVPGAMYFLVLTESPSTPLGSTYGDGFSGDGQGNYTGGIYGCGSGPFCDIDGNQRNGNWAVDITGVTSASIASVPEPGSLWLIAFATAGLAVFWRRRSRSSAGQPS
jgi:hypothetical protein